MKTTSSFPILKVFFLVALLTFASCSEEKNSEIPEQNLLADYGLSVNSKIVHNGTVYTMEDQQSIEKAIDLLDQAYATNYDEEYVFVYSEEDTKSLNLEEIDDFAHHNLDANKAAFNPIIFTFTLYKDKNFSGQSLQYRIRRDRIRSNPFGSEIIRLSRIRKGSFNNVISSFRLQTTNTGRDFMARNQTKFSEVFVDFYSNGSVRLNEGFIGYTAIYPKKNADNTLRNVSVPDLSSIRFFENRFGGLSPEGSGVRNWNNKISAMDFGWDFGE